MRINVLGTSGSGKSTFGKKLADKLNVPYVQLNELFWKTFFTRDSIILWTLKMFHKNRKDYPKLFEKPEYSHIKFIRLRSTKEVDDFLRADG